MDTDRRLELLNELRAAERDGNKALVAHISALLGLRSVEPERAVKAPTKEKAIRRKKEK